MAVRILVSRPRYSTKVGPNKLDGVNHSVRITGARGRRVNAARKGDVLSNSHRVK